MADTAAPEAAAQASHDQPSTEAAHASEPSAEALPPVDAGPPPSGIPTPLKNGSEEKAPSRPTTASGRPQPQSNKKGGAATTTAPGSRTNSRNNLAKKTTLSNSKGAVNTSKSQVITTSKTDVNGSKGNVATKVNGDSKSNLVKSKEGLAKSSPVVNGAKKEVVKPAVGSKENGAPAAAPKPAGKPLGSKGSLAGSKGALVKAEVKTEPAADAVKASRPTSGARKTAPPSRPATSQELNKENHKLKNEGMEDEIKSLRGSVEQLSQKHDGAKGADASVDTLVDSHLRKKMGATNRVLSV
ncbi:hypothetical protein BC829DRAFT_406158 [Chytridium lagenaria]|nr:hypothetical protein BC829DRAFT_406158 [Chytridium lagenaria]